MQMAATIKTFKEELDALHRHKKWRSGYGRARN